jgi:hypothetical protein
MFAHTGFRPLWPVIFFLPWFLLGAVYVLQAIVQRRVQGTPQRLTIGARALGRSWRLRGSVALVAVAALAVAHYAFADPAADGARRCAAASAQEAQALADMLYEKGEYQRAGECYDAAGDSIRAQRAFLRAIRPNTEAAARGLKEDSDNAKALFTRVQDAFRSSH